MNTSDSAPSLEVEHVAKSYGRRRVLADVSFALKPGVVAAVTGENGSGKSTLLNILVGRLRPDAGRVRCAGRVGYCPQELLLFESLTVEENFRYFATAYGLDAHGADDWRAARGALLARFRFEPFLKTPVHQLSGGTKQKLNLALALLADPDVLILDEPYSGFDWETYLRFWELTRELRVRSRTTLIVSHLVFDRTQFDAVYRLEKGVLACA
jgi:ABC-type multidrug transport system ATPase subunit